MSLVEFYKLHADQEVSDFRFVALKELLKKSFTGRSVMDIGCGTGAMIRELARENYEVAGIEPDPALFALALELKGRTGMVFDLANSDVENLPAEATAGFTDFLLLDILEHTENDAAVLEKVYLKMPAGSRLLCLLPALKELYGKRDTAVGHFRRYDMKNAMELFSRLPFRNANFAYWNMLGAWTYWLFEKVLRHPVPEWFRLGERRLTGAILNSLLLGWFRLVENRGRSPIGLSILVIAEK